MKIPARSSLFTYPRNRHGFTLTELAIVLGIIGSILGAIWVAAASVHRGNQADQAAQELQTISENMLTLYQNRTLPAPACGGDLTANAISGGVVPSWAVVPGACASASNPWSGAGGSLTVISKPARHFGITFSSVPVNGCIALLLQGTGCDPNQAGCPTGAIVTAGAAVNEAPAGAPLNWTGMTPAKAATDCTGGGVTDTVEFDFSF